MLGGGKVLKVTHDGSLPPLITGKWILQAASNTALYVLDATFTTSPSKPLGLGIGLQMLVGSFIFTKGSPRTLTNGKMLISVISGIRTWVAVTSFSSL